MKKLLEIAVLGYRIMWDKLGHKLGHLEIDQGLGSNEQRKRK